jgi:DNA mismatch endonuclease (patch repair protein)
MAAIRGSHTKPELIVRKALHAAGLRYRLHVRGLPGTPDMVFSKHQAVVFINGCFWHLHDCHLFKWPSTRTDFWEKKLHRNAANDEAAIKALRSDGWRIAIVWECALKGKTRLDQTEAMQLLVDWIKSSVEMLVIEGK